MLTILTCFVGLWESIDSFLGRVWECLCVLVEPEPDPALPLSWSPCLSFLELPTLADRLRARCSWNAFTRAWRFALMLS